ncbi:hypothetical protein [Herpetosiphon llansteffanensis]|uniref:hypothetical protein n=1 Tax=Herpetosiphon llansteffanensis TaxID=2094568 RepID=UPI000D7C68CF|nr:hypothetical protein [Herpetosiphon llansteffanensis]
MHCPRCRQNVDLTINQCPKCKRKLKPLVLSQQIPLSKQQRQALRSEIVVLSIALGFLVCIATILYFALKGVSGLIWPIFGLMLAVVGFYWLSRVRDLLGGNAHVQIDQLLELRYVRTRRKTHLYGDFKLIGSQHLKMEHSDVAREGNYYVVTYSPRNNHVWELAKLQREVA